MPLLRWGRLSGERGEERKAESLFGCVCEKFVWSNEGSCRLYACGRTLKGSLSQVLQPIKVVNATLCIERNIRPLCSLLYTSLLATNFYYIQ